MKRRIRKRCVFKWVGVVLCAGLGTAWVVGFFWTVHLSFGTSGFAIYEDSIRYWFSADPLPTGLLIETADEFYRYRFGGYRYRYIAGVSVRISMLVVPTVLATAWLWRLDCRRVCGCFNCGYDLRGNVSGVCPECGTAIPLFESATTPTHASPTHKG
ncbi:MAG: hypothetical protein GXP29_11445 [Planctomycetes bacterium]|nr:hypothetical protein [Planctomycetota bacterium]